MEPKQILNDIIFEIQSNSFKCKWFMDSLRLSELLQMSKEEFYRKLYRFKTSKPERDTRLGFNEIDGDLLVEFLHFCLDITGIQDKFTNAGIYFDESTLYSLREHYKFLLRDSLHRHDLDKDTLLLLAAASQNFDDAIDSYISDKFEIEFFVDRTVQEFIILRKIFTEGGADLFLKDYLLALIPTKILNIRAITQEFRDRSYYELFGSYREDAKKKWRKRNIQNKEIKALMEYFGLVEGFQKDDLKKEFKNLLKKFHPDVNKDGLIKTQEIIQKYNELIFILNKNPQ